MRDRLGTFYVILQVFMHPLISVDQVFDYFREMDAVIPVDISG